MISPSTSGRALARDRMAGRIRTVELPLLRRVPDPADYREHVTADGRRVFLAKRVVRDLAELELSEHPKETAGLLFGGHFTDEGRACTVVTKLVRPRPGEVRGTRSSVTITPTGAERMIARAWQEDPLLAPVGWGHTHPCFEAYFSGVDRTEQQAWRHAGSVGLVISGLPEPMPRYRVFVGPESAPAEPVRRTDGSAETPASPLEISQPARDRERPRAHPSRSARRLAPLSRRLRVWLLPICLLATLAISLYAARTADFARRQAREARQLATELVRPPGPTRVAGVGAGLRFPNLSYSQLEFEATEPSVQGGVLRP
jgi:proteasome lid subunit RPN8/RPN11